MSFAENCNLVTEEVVESSSTEEEEQEDFFGIENSQASNFSLNEEEKKFHKMAVK